MTNPENSMTVQVDPVGVDAYFQVGDGATESSSKDTDKDAMELSMEPLETDHMNGLDRIEELCSKPLNEDEDEDDTDLDDISKRPHKNPCIRFVVSIEDAVHKFHKENHRRIVIVVRIVLFSLYMWYFGNCMHYSFGDTESYTLLVITCCLCLYIAVHFIPKKFSADNLRSALGHHVSNSKRCRKYFNIGLCLAVTAGLAVYLGLFVVSNNPRNAQALIGVLCLVILCYIFSYKSSRVNWHTVFWGFVVQFVFAFLVLRTGPGYSAFSWTGMVVHEFVGLSDKGSRFVLGASFDADGAGFFFSTAGVIVFFNSVIFLLEHWGILEFIVLKIGKLFAVCLDTGPVESVVAAANIFIGLSEAPLLVRPYLPHVTMSELHAIMTCGFASISGAFMAMFIQAGAPASHLLTAAVISAPASLAISKLMYPETEKINYTNQRNVKMRDETSHQNLLQAYSEGAGFSIKLVAAIMVNMMAFVSALNMVDHILLWAGARVGISGLTTDLICSYLLFPISYGMGADTADCGPIGGLIGIKLVATPFVAYVDLGRIIQNRRVLEDYVLNANGSWHWSGKDVIMEATNTTLVGGFMSERSEVIVTYAMCGISALPAIGFTMGTLIPMCPARKKDVAKLVFRAFIAGNMANFVTGAVAGVMFSDTSIPLPH